MLYVQQSLYLREEAIVVVYLTKVLVYTKTYVIWLTCYTVSIRIIEYTLCFKITTISP